MGEIRRFRHKPTVVSAVRWTGGNTDEVFELTGCQHFAPVDPLGRAGDPGITAEVWDKLHSTWIGVKTGQWVARGTKGELWPVDHEVLTETYDPAEELARPSAGELWERAGGNRELYRDLLRQHGHLLAPGDPGYDPGAPQYPPCGWRP